MAASVGVPEPDRTREGAWDIGRTSVSEGPGTAAAAPAVGDGLEAAKVSRGPSPKRGRAVRGVRPFDCAG
ncbi:hypothetical protein GCM10010508_21200 [Streptomyces naganishii JCM 4654]|uniref:Uncharacterized protein n=1 Tax=Streptomyces naganishii JCM 4654 TaxID=1306179 RepID=A0A918Y2U5_9ACTN|nr:hypothetical protein GCM10010508_21200 [Streptomyces naganishii JCM 4654]